MIHPCKFTFLLLVVYAQYVFECDAACYFPAELQGEFVMQSTVTAGSQVQYSKVNITAESIPIWGHCHRRIGNNVILMDISGGGNCIRCFHLNLRSKNVLQVRTEGLDKCYTKEDAAVATCPGEHTGVGAKLPERLKEILLYKTKELGGEDIRKEYCPINGHYTFTYNLNEGSENKPECPDPVSELDNCPSASGLNLRFRRCSFENHDITFQCLGHWAGPGRQRYLALLDTRVGAERRAQYRCALYQEDVATGNIYMAFSSDSTCTSDLRSSTDGFETMILNTVPGSRWPPRVEASTCRFPSWSQGHWEHADIEGNTLTYKDHTIFKTSNFKCIGSDAGREEKFLIFSRNQCGEERYSCIWMKKRDINVFEFQIGVRSSDYFNASLCSESNFQDDAWITQGKMDIVKESPCPIAGEYTGMIPDAVGLCAKLYSDCNNPEIMFYTVSDCSDQPEVYEGSRMRNPSRFSRWRRQVQHRQIGTRIYHISNPRPITTSPSLTSILSPVPSTDYQTTSLPPNNFWNVPYDVSKNENPYQIPLQLPTNENERLPYNLNIQNPPPFHNSQGDPNNRNNNYSSLPSKVFPRREYYSDIPLVNYDNSGYTRRPGGYDAPYNIPYSRFPSVQSNVPPDMGYHNNPSHGYNTGYSGYVGSSRQDQPGISQASETAFSAEEYDPWAFPKIHSRKNQNLNYSQLIADTQWNSNKSPPPIQQQQYPSTPAPISISLIPTLKTTFPPFFERRPGNNEPSPVNATRNNISPTKREEREYRCLGQWEEDGLMYTYTQRRDVGNSYECFVGSIKSNTEIYIKEAGEHCQRRMDPLRLGMKLTKRGEVGSCFGTQATVIPPRLPPSRPRPTTSWYSSKRPPEPTKPWKPITGPPRDRIESGAMGSHNRVGILVAFISIILFLGNY